MRPGLFTVLGMCLLLASACGPNSEKQNNRQGTSGSTSDTQSDASGSSAPDSAETARQNAIDELEGETYEDVMGSGDCTQDCSGHNAGWEWAKTHEILDPDECSGNSDSFIDGCKAYGEEVERRASESDDGSDAN
jgi:hypothetical protein